MCGFFPIFLRSYKIDVVVIGGGTVGTIRAKELLKAGFKVKVISKDFSSELKELEKSYQTLFLFKKEININTKLELKELIRDTNLVISATGNPALNKDICELAREMGKLCNDPSNMENSDFIIPISMVNNDFGVAVTTFGISSIVSKEILNRINSDILASKEIINLLHAMAEIKVFLKENVKDPKRRYHLYHEIFDDREFNLRAKEGDIKNALERAKEIVGDEN